VANQGVSDNPAVETSAAVDTNQQSTPVLRRLRQIEDAVRHMSRHSSSFELPPEVARLGERLRRVGVCEDVTRALLPKVLRRVQEEDLDNREAVVTAAAELLYEQLPERADLRIGRERKVVAFVGPSGSGKTTAIAKISAGFVRRLSRRPDYKEGEIVIVSTDTQRVGALAQARAYADLIGVPLEDAHDAQDLARILAHHDKARLILIDTAGIGPHEVKQREQLRALLSTAVVDEVQVVLDGRTSYDHMLDIIEVCDGEQPRRLLLSKMDEAMHPGAALSAAIAGTMQSSFFTTGPAIPGGISPGDLRRLVDWVVGRCPSPFAPDGSHSSKTADN
jgi:flagellar biosynthesis protein FlhF